MRNPFIEEPANTYHDKAKEFLSSHQLGDFRRNPFYYRQKQLGIIKSPDSTAYLVGRAAHSLILEGKAQFDKEFVVGGPVNPKTGEPYGPLTKAYKEWAAKQTKDVISLDQYELIRNMDLGVKRHEDATELLCSGVAEGVIRISYCGVPCQIRMDWYNFARDAIVDLKTCANLDWFELDAKKFEYAHQLSFYRSVYAAARKKYVPVYLVAVEKQEPYRCGVWLMEPGILDQAEADNEEAIEELKECREKDLWPTRFEGIRTFNSIFPPKNKKKEIVNKRTLS